MSRVASPASSLQVAYTMEDTSAVLRQALDTTPGSIRELARAAGVSETLLRLARDGERRLTPEVRDAVVAALRSWETSCGDAAEALERCDLDPPQGGDDG